VRFAPVAVGSVRIEPGRLALIAGPCVLEDDAMAEEVAQEVKRIAVSLGMPFVFKASFAKANRSSRESYRGPGAERGLPSLARIRERVGVPVTSDVHETSDVAEAARSLDLLQIPAFLCRQTALLEAAGASGKPVHVKKGQFLDPASMGRAVEKVRAAGAPGVIVTERGTTFGYGDLVVDMRDFKRMREACGVPIIFDATHSVQRPGQGSGGASGGAREFIPPLTLAAIAAGADGLFLETHPKPDEAPSDGPNMLPLKQLPELLDRVIAVWNATRG